MKETVEQASAEWIVETERILPSDNVKIYRKVYSHYQNLYPSLKDHFSSIAEIA